MKVRDVMRAEGLLSVKPDEPLGLAAQMMAWGGVRHLPVVREAEVIGVLSERDVLGFTAEVGIRAAAREAVSRAMHAPAVTVSPDDPITTATTLMISRKVGCLPVVSPHGLVGIVTTTDLLRNELETSLHRPANDLPPPLRTVMKPALSLTEYASLRDAVALMNARCIRHLPVVGSDGVVVGILSDRDVRAAIGDPRHLIDDPYARSKAITRTVGELMSKVVVTLDQEAPLTAAIEHLVHEGMGALPIVDQHRRLVGIVSYLDVIQALR